MQFHENLRVFGRLELLEIYDFHDTPLFVSCKNSTGSIYFAVAVKAPEAESETGDYWLYLPVSRERYAYIRSGGIDLHSAFLEPEDGFAYLVNIPTDKHIDAVVKAIDPANLNDNLLPARGEYLQLSTTTLPQLDSVEHLAVSTRRDVVRFTLSLPQYRRSEAPARLLGAFLTSVQDIVATLARGILGSRGMPVLQELAVVGVGGGSFAVDVAFAGQVRLFTEADSPSNETFREFLYILSASDSADTLAERLTNRPRVAKGYLAMLRAVDGRIDRLTIDWGSPRPGESAHIDLSGATVDAAIAVLERKAPSSEKTFDLVCRLVGANIVKKSFEIWSLEADGRHYTGKIAESALNTVDGATLGGIYRAFLLVTEALKPATGDIVEDIQMIQLLHVAVGSDGGVAGNSLGRDTNRREAG